MSTPETTTRRRLVIARAANGQPRTLRLAPAPATQAAYRRLAAAILGLDVPTLARDLRAVRESLFPLAA